MGLLFFFQERRFFKAGERRPRAFSFSAPGLACPPLRLVAKEMLFSGREPSPWRNFPVPSSPLHPGKALPC